MLYHHIVEDFALSLDDAAALGDSSDVELPEGIGDEPRGALDAARAQRARAASFRARGKVAWAITLERASEGALEAASLLLSR